MPEMPALPVLLAWSGGKDAAWTLHVLRLGGEVEVVGLLSTITREYGRASMQGVRRQVLQAQARAATGSKQGLLLCGRQVAAGSRVGRACIIHMRCASHAA